jgi:hypothetical protein
MNTVMSGGLAGLGMPGARGIKIKKLGFTEKKDRNIKYFCHPRGNELVDERNHSACDRPA